MLLLKLRSDEHPWVMLDTNAARVWLEHASLEHKPVNQVLMGPITEVPGPPRKIGGIPAAFKHWASVETAIVARVDWHGAETVTALEK
jgi:hypothetical protein